MLNYTLFDHTADIGVEIFGRTKKDLFTNAAFALFDILIQDTGNNDKSNQKTRERVKTRTVNGADVEDLLINFLRELLYLFNGLGLVVNQGMIADCSMKRLIVKLTVEPYDPKRHLIKTELKAVTYHGLAVEKTTKGWRARVIFDV